eukprot:147052_1
MSNDKLFFDKIPAQLALTVDKTNLNLFGKKQWTQIALLAGTEVSVKKDSRTDMVNKIRKHCLSSKLTYNDLRTRMVNFNNSFKEEREEEEIKLQGIDKVDASTDTSKKGASTITPSTPNTNKQNDTNQFMIDENGYFMPKSKATEKSGKNVSELISNGEEFSNIMNLNQNTNQTPTHAKSIKNSKRTELNRDNITYVHEQLHNLEKLVTKKLDSLVSGMNT